MNKIISLAVLFTFILHAGIADLPLDNAVVKDTAVASLADSTTTDKESSNLVGESAEGYAWKFPHIMDEYEKAMNDTGDNTEEMNIIALRGIVQSYMYIAENLDKGTYTEQIAAQKKAFETLPLLENSNYAVQQTALAQMLYQWVMLCIKATNTDNHLDEVLGEIENDYENGVANTEKPEHLLVNALYRTVDALSVLVANTSTNTSIVDAAEKLLQEHLAADEQSQTVGDQLNNASQKIFEYTCLLLLSMDSSYRSTIKELQTIATEFETEKNSTTDKTVAHFQMAFGAAYFLLEAFAAE